MKIDVLAQPSRRQFLSVTAGTALGVVWPHVGQSNTTSSPVKSSTKTTHALGTKVSITALHPDADNAALAIDEAFDELRLVESLMSIYQADSQLSRLNRDRVLERPHPYFLEVLRAASEMSSDSGGAFDITVQPMWSLLAEARRHGTLPSDEQLDAARRRVDWRQVEVSPHRVQLHGNSAITLNGIAQGFAADRAEAALRKRGVEQALINTGEINALGRKAAGDAWTVGVQHPRREDAYVALADLAGRCLATSGDYATTFSEDYRWNHLFDPRTGRSPEELCSVSVVAKTGLAADALSTAVFVLGFERGLDLIRSTAGADALLVRKDGRTHATSGFPVQL